MTTRTLPLLTAMAVSLVTLFEAPAAHAAVHTMIVTSDPQFPWRDETLFAPIARDDAELRERAREMITEQYESIAAYRAARPDENIPVIVNGDLTAFGHPGERSDMKALYDILGGTREGNVHLGLGNHDYENNVNQCAFNRCAAGSIDDFVAHVQGKKEKTFFDFATQSGAFSTGYTGSLAYAFATSNQPRTLQLQLNNHPGYTVDFQAGATFQSYYSITPSVSFARHILKENMEVPPYGTPADRPYDFAIVHMHNADKITPEFEEALHGKDVVAVFAGHLHRLLGQYRTLGDGTPVFLSGSASTRSYLIVENDTDREELRVYKVRDNDPEKKVLDRTVSTRHT